MSREERRQYQRQMKSMERGASLPPAAQARAERNAARREARRAATGPRAPSSRRFWIRVIVVAAAAGFLAFSFQWPNMPFALYVGIGVTLVVLALAYGFRLLRRRSRPREDWPRAS